jgi:uncharacterized protein (TIGR03083 family)
MGEQQAQAEVASVEEARRRVDASWDGWLAALDGVPEERLTEPGVCGDWSVKDLIGHVAYWDDDALADVERIMKGRGLVAGTADERNATAAAANAARSLDELRAEMAQTHETVVGVLRGLDPDDPRTLRICREVAEDTWEHYDDHAAEVRSWRQRVGL